jgi:hypothetical protein
VRPGVDARDKHGHDAFFSGASFKAAWRETGDLSVNYAGWAVK